MNSDGFTVFMIAALVATAVLLRPVARAWARRLEGGAAHADTLRELDDVRARLTELESAHAHLQELEDRVEFAERMLAQRHEPLQLPEQRTPV